MTLRVELQPHLFNQFELGFQEIDMLLLVLGKFLKQAFGDPVAHTIAVLGRFQIKGSGVQLGGKVRSLLSPERSCRSVMGQAPACLESRQKTGYVQYHSPKY